MVDLKVKEQKQISGGKLHFIVSAKRGEGDYVVDTAYTVQEEKAIERRYRKKGYTDIEVVTKGY